MAGVRRAARREPTTGRSGGAGPCFGARLTGFADALRADSSALAEAAWAPVRLQLSFPAPGRAHDEIKVVVAWLPAEHLTDLAVACDQDGRIAGPARAFFDREVDAAAGRVERSDPRVREPAYFRRFA